MTQVHFIETGEILIADPLIQSIFRAMQKSSPEDREEAEELLKKFVIPALNAYKAEMSLPEQIYQETQTLFDKFYEDLKKISEKYYQFK